MVNLQDKIDAMLLKDRKGIFLGLEAIEKLLNALGRPQDKMPKVIHVAGTNGKGSTIAFLRAILSNYKKKVHIYTSPHLVRWNERIVVSGEVISDEYLFYLLQVVEKTAEKNSMSPSFFEMMTAAAFLAFSENPADYVLLETGLGGRLDATNIIDENICAVITSLSKDHTELLGDTLEKIAYEKACIIKPNSTAVIASAPSSVLKILQDYAKLKKTRILIEGVDFSVDYEIDSNLVYNGALYPKPCLLGKHQYQNAALAITVAKKILNIPDSAIKKGLENAKWPGRLQNVVDGNLASMMPDGWELWIDGGHNQGAAEVLAKFLPCWQDKPLYGIWGMINSKKPEEFIAQIAKFFDEIQTVEIVSNSNSYTCLELAKLVEKYGKKGAYADSVESAIKEITKRQKGRILIFGSLYLLGDVLQKNQEI